MIDQVQTYFEKLSSSIEAKVDFCSEQNFSLINDADDLSIALTDALKEGEKLTRGNEEEVTELTDETRVAGQPWKELKEQMMRPDYDESE